MGTYSAEPILVRAPKLAERLEAAMREASLSAREVAKRSGVDKATISRWCNDDRPVELERVRLVAGVLDTSAEFLLDLPTRDGDDDQQPTIPASLLRRAAKLEPQLLAGLEEMLPDLRHVIEGLNSS